MVETCRPAGIRHHGVQYYHRVNFAAGSVAVQTNVLTRLDYGDNG